MQVCDEDLELIKQCGAPIEPGFDLVLFGDGDAVFLTDRGKLFYRTALSMHGLAQEKVDGIRTRTDLRQITLDIKRVRVSREVERLSKALNDGKIPVRSRECANAFLSAQWKKLKRAVERREFFDSAGPNIIPVDFYGRTS